MCSAACMLISIPKKKASSKVYTKFQYKVHMQCVYASPNQIGGFRVRDERRTLFALSMFSTFSVLLPLSLDTYSLYSFLQNRYYRYLDGHLNHQCAYIS